MEIVFSRKNDAFIENGKINGVYGDILDLIDAGTIIEGIVYDDEWTVKRFLNGMKLRLSERISGVFTYLELDIKLLSRKIKTLSRTDLKFVLLAYLLLNNYKNIIFDYFDIGLDYKDQKRLMKIIRNLHNDGFSILVISNNLVFMDSIVEKIFVFNNKELVFEGKMLDLIKNNQSFIEIPDIIKFIEMANSKDARLDYTLDSKELLKDIYRSVY